MPVIKKYQAMDGSEHGSQEGARLHDRQLHLERVVGLTLDEVSDALTGKNPAKGAALEYVAAQIAKARIERGGAKRKTAAKG